MHHSTKSLRSILATKGHARHIIIPVDHLSDGESDGAVQGEKMKRDRRLLLDPAATLDLSHCLAYS
jgi:hypothetical protein